MSYQKRELTDGVTIIDKDLLDHMQDGILAASENITGISDLAEVCLAKQYDLVVGDTFQLYYRGVVKCFDINSAGILVKCAKGRAYPRFYEFTPTEAEVGEYELTLTTRTIYGEVRSTGTTKIVVHPKPTFNTPTNFNLLVIGDSLTYGGVWPAEGLRRILPQAQTNSTATTPATLSVDNLTITTYGKSKSTVDGYTIKHDAYSGWHWLNYISAENAYSTTNGIVVTLNEAHNYELNTVQKSEWKDNNGKLWELEDFPSSTQIKFNRGQGNTAQQNQSTLPTSLTCEALSLSITPKTVTWEPGNPFWNETTGKLDFIQHASECNTDKADILACLLTWNMNGRNDGAFGDLDFTFQTNRHREWATTFLRQFHKDFPNAKIILLGLQVPSITGGIGANYVTNTFASDMWGMAMYAFDYSKMLEELSESDEFKDFCYYADTKGQFDTENMMPYSMQKVNPRSTATEKRGTNGVHPSSEGYRQIGDVFFRKMVAVLNEQAN